VDPVKTLEIARALTNRPLLRGIVADGVRSDGSVDVSEGPGQVRYAFQSAMGEGALPLHEPGTLPRRQFCGKQDVELRRDGLAAEPDAPEHMCSAQEVDALPEPRCDLKRVWAHALEKGAPRDQLARIEYYRSKVGPAWRFELRSGEQRFSLYGDCGRELSAGEADGFVP
jgi:hypothetical protein